jgi:hypothetical protein
MVRLAAIAVATVALLASASPAQSQDHAFFGGVRIGVRGWGSVQPGKGFDVHTPVSCIPSSCKSALATARTPHITLVAKPHPGWKLARWSGACTGTKPKCVVDLSRARADSFGGHVRLVHARFDPVAPGLTRTNPLPLGNAASIYGVWKIQVNSTTPKAQLSTPPPPGAEYFAANLTATFLEPAVGNLNGLSGEVIGSHNVVYGRPSPTGNGCPNGEPAPYLPLVTPEGDLPGGESATGNLCWLIATNDESSLELRFTFGGPAFFVTEWFALH